MISKKPLVAAVDIANRFHAANFQNFSKRFNLDAAVRNGMAVYEHEKLVEKNFSPAAIAACKAHGVPL